VSDTIYVIGTFLVCSLPLIAAGWAVDLYGEGNL
jgi:hypothetical protein